MHQTVYIFKCEKSNIKVNGKANSITLDSCKRCNIVFDNVVAAFDTVNCQSIEAQVNGKVPTIQVDKTDGFNMYLSEESMNAQIITAKISAMNLNMPIGEQGDFKEFALPEQFVTVWNGSKLVTDKNDN